MQVKLLISLLIMLMSSPCRAQASSLVPIFNYEYRSHIIELLEIAALEPEIKKIKTRKAAKRAYKRVTNFMIDIKGGANERASRIGKEYRRAASALRFYLINSHLAKSKKRARFLRVALKKLASLYAGKTRKKSKAIIARYYEYVAAFGLDRGGSSISSLVTIKPKLARNRLLVENIDLIVGYSLIQAKSTLGQAGVALNRSPKSSVYGRLAHRLTKAMYESGVNVNGEILQPKNKAYQSSLAYALRVSRGAPKGVQHKVVDTAFFIWSKVDQGIRGGPPFDIGGMDQLLPVKHFNESRAIALARKGKIVESLDIYRFLANLKQKKSHRLKLDRRVWEIELSDYKINGVSNNLRFGFNKVSTKYGKSKKKSGKRFYQEAFAEYRSIIMELLARGVKNPKQAAYSINEALYFLKFIDSREKSYPIREKLAQLYDAGLMYREAVSAYLDLAKDKPGKNTLLAIRAQSALAKWPTEPPLTGIPQGPQNERSKLLSIYNSLLKKNGAKANWKILSHMGLLYFSLGKKSSMENLWQTNLLKSTKPNKYASEAAGFLFREYVAAKNWIKLINLTQNTVLKKITITRNYQPIAFQKPFSDALLNQGQLDFKSKNYGQSVKYFTDFIKFFKSDSRVPLAYHSLGLAYKNLGKIPQALANYKFLVDNYPNYSQIKKVLIEGGALAKLNPATTEFAFFFDRLFLSKYPKDPMIPRLRRELADLYLSKKLYGWATRLYKEQRLSPAVPPQWQLEAAVKYLETEQKYGRLEEAAFGAKRILQLAKPGSEPEGKAYGFLALSAVAKSDTKALKALEPKLTFLARSSVSAREALGHVKFKQAELTTRLVENKLNNAFLKNPEGAIKTFYDKFLSEKQHYESVCKIGVTTSCAPSQLRLVYLAQSAMRAIKAVEIAATLGETRVNAFNVFKQLHLSKLEESARSYASFALRLAQRGTTTNIWKAEIMRTLGNKVNFGISH